MDFYIFAFQYPFPMDGFDDNVSKFVVEGICEADVADDSTFEIGPWPDLWRVLRISLCMGCKPLL